MRAPRALSYCALMRIDLHTPVVPERWEDFAGRYGGGRWPRLIPRDVCRATIMTGDAVFREITWRRANQAYRARPREADRLFTARPA